MLKMRKNRFRVYILFFLFYSFFLRQLGVSGSRNLLCEGEPSLMEAGFLSQRRGEVLHLHYVI